jgi:DNA primase
MISRSTIDLVMDASRIEDVVGDFVSLKRRGSSMLGLCPFHNEKSPSFNVSPTRGIFKCFGCGQAGNSVKFIMEHEKLSYPESIRYLAKKYNITIEEENQPEEAKQEILERESLFLVNQWATQFFSLQLWETEHGKSIAHSYFKERGFSNETILKFQLGYHPDGWSAFTDSAIKEGYNSQYLVKTGLSIEKDGKYFDRFRNRVMFPIHNLSGKIIGFGGRILVNDKKQAKYLNSPESDIYHKSQVLYGIHLARKSMMGQDEAYLVEGYTDVISLHQAGIENVVSSSGTSLTVDQVKLIERFTKNVTILYDGDSAGIKASFRGIDMILEQGMNVKIVLFPEGEDPDSFARKNAPLFIKEYLKTEAKDFIAFKTAVLQEEASGDPIRTAEMIKEIMHSLALVPDAILRSVYIRQCSSKLQIEEQTLINELNKQIRTNQKKKFDHTPESAVNPEPDFFLSDQEAQPAPQIESYRAQSQESDILRILIKYSNQTLIFHQVDENDKAIDVIVRVGDFVLSELMNDGLEPENAEYRSLFSLFSEAEEGDYPDESYFLHHTDPAISSTAIHLTSNPYILSDHWKDRHQVYITNEEDLLRKTVLTAVYSFKMRRLLMMLRTAQDKLKKSTDDAEQLSILESLLGLQKAQKELGEQLSYVLM